MKPVPNGNPYKRSRNFFTQLSETWEVFNNHSCPGFTFVDLFVYRWYKNFIEDKKI